MHRKKKEASITFESLYNRMLNYTAQKDSDITFTEGFDDFAKSDSIYCACDAFVIRVSLSYFDQVIKLSVANELENIVKAYFGKDSNCIVKMDNDYIDFIFLFSKDDDYFFSDDSMLNMIGVFMGFLYMLMKFETDKRARYNIFCATGNVFLSKLSDIFNISYTKTLYESISINNIQASNYAFSLCCTKDALDLFCSKEDQHKFFNTVKINGNEYYETQLMNSEFLDKTNDIINSKNG